LRAAVSQAQQLRQQPQQFQSYMAPQMSQPWSHAFYGADAQAMLHSKVGHPGGNKAVRGGSTSLMSLPTMMPHGSESASTTPELTPSGSVSRSSSFDALDSSPPGLPSPSAKFSHAHALFSSPQATYGMSIQAPGADGPAAECVPRTSLF